MKLARMLPGRRRLVVQLMVTLLITLVVTGAVQYTLAERVLGQWAGTGLEHQVRAVRVMLLLSLGGCLLLALPLHYLVGHALTTWFGRAIEDSTTDALTGLRNHRGFHEDVRRQIELARRHGRSLSLAVIDLDRFEQTNDLLGHRAGDRVLNAVGLILRQGRPEDLCYRIGGDEFAVLLPETQLEGALTVVERVRLAVDRQVEGVTTSIGVAALSVHTPDLETLLESAGAALGAAKRQGRNRVAAAETPMEPAAS